MHTINQLLLRLHSGALAKASQVQGFQIHAISFTTIWLASEAELVEALGDSLPARND